MFRQPAQYVALAIATLTVANMSAYVQAQEPDVVQVQRWITDLASPEFEKRQAATESLRKSSEDAIPVLESALKSAVGDQRVLIQMILRTLSRNSLAGRIAGIEKAPSAKAVAGFPEWDRFAALVGTQPENVRQYLSVVKADQKLFAAAMKKDSALPDLLESRSADLLKSTRPTPVSADGFSADRYLALLLLAGNEQVRLPRATSYNISKILAFDGFRSSVKGDENQWRLRIAGDYILRGRIDPVAPLMFAREQKLPEGLTLARQVVQNSLRSKNGLYAMILIREFGDASDITLLETLFGNAGVLFEETTAKANGKRYVVTNGDLAQAVALVMRKRDPRDFGFPMVDERSAPFRFAMDTVGFFDPQDREAARKSYSDAFLTNQAK